MFLFLLSFAHALPTVSGDVQLVIGKQGFQWGSNYIANQVFDIEMEDIGAAYECWDRVGIRDFNLEVDVKDVDFQLNQGQIVVTSRFYPIRGEDMEVYTEDSDWIDLCPQLDRDLNYIEIDNLYVELQLKPSVRNDKVELLVQGDPVVSGDISMDISWFPSSLTLYFFENLLFEQIGDMMAEKLPELVDDYANGLAYAGEIDVFSLAVAVQDAEVEPGQLRLGADVDLHYITENDCHSELGPVNGRTPELDFAQIDSASFGIGFTEKALNQTLGDLWSEGFFCFSEDDFEVLFDEISVFFNTEVGNFSAAATVENAPVLTIDSGSSGGISTSVDGAVLTVRGSDSNAILLDATVNIEAHLALTVNPAISTFGISVHDIELEFVQIRLDSLLTEDPYAEDHIRRLVENWAVEQLEEKASYISVYQAMFSSLGFYIFVEDIQYQEGGVELYLNVFHESDAEVDLEPPDTQVSVDYVIENSAKVSWSGLDNHTSDLAYSYRLDQGSWSSWTTETSHVFDDLIIGQHQIAVKARDRWWNEDPLPATNSFQVLTNGADDSSAPVKDDGCGCSSDEPQQATFGVLLLALLAMQRRRLT